MVTCYDCHGDGYTVFLGKESTCKNCRGEGELLICGFFSLAPDALVVFRNQRCHNCGVKEDDHITSEVTAVTSDGQK